MGVQALHAHARATHAPFGLDEFGANGRQAAPTGVLVVRALQLIGVNQDFEAVHSPVAFESTHGVVQLGIDEPVQRGHGRTVSKVGLVLDDDGTPVRATDDHRETPGERSAQQRFDEREIVGGRVPKGQRQNSKVRTRRETYAFVVWCVVGGEPESGVADEGETSGCRPGSAELGDTWPAEFPGST